MPNGTGQVEQAVFLRPEVFFFNGFPPAMSQSLALSTPGELPPPGCHRGTLKSEERGGGGWAKTPNGFVSA